VRVVMYVHNDVTRDSRVLREAATLAAEGHEVTIMGTPLVVIDGHAEGAPPPPGVRIERHPVPEGKPWWLIAFRAPWRVRHPIVVLLVPWILVRASWVLVVNRILARPVKAGGLDFLARWSRQWLGWCRVVAAAAPVADVHHAHDMEALPAARMAAKRDRSVYVYDSHEVYLEWGHILNQPGYIRRAFAMWERFMARRAQAVVTIGEGVGAELRERLAPRRLVIVRNCPAAYTPTDNDRMLLRTRVAVDRDTPIVLCHGGFMPNRGLQETALALLEPGLENAHLVFMGYRVHFIEKILEDRRLAGRVHFIQAVEPDEVVQWVSGADVDVMAIQVGDLNSQLSLPNKLFESLAAGVPVVSTDLPERRSVILGDPEGPLGALCDPTDPASIAAALRSILDQPADARLAQRERILRAAHRRWNWGAEVAGLVKLYADLAARRSARSAGRHDPAVRETS
jgi:glycosyltransferase involved in cell wall biosynthesis